MRDEETAGISGTHEGFDDLNGVARRILAFRVQTFHAGSIQKLFPPSENP